MRSIRGRTAVAAAAALAMAVVLAGCEDFLSVSDPSRFVDDDLDNPRALPAVANGVEGQMHIAHLQTVIHTALLSDEWMHTGTWAGYEDSDKGRHRPNSGNSVSAGALMSARTQAQRAEERFLRVLGDTANRTRMMAQVKATEAWTHLLQAMVNCEGVAEPEGPALTDAQMYQVAIPAMTRAIELAQQGNHTVYVNFARAGRARANLMLGNHDAALADAQAIPLDYVYSAKYSEQGTANSMYTLHHYAENKAAGLDERRWAQVDTMAGYLIDRWSGELDPRVRITHRIGNRLGVDGRTKHYSQEKYPARNAPIPMTHGLEMRLIEAEIYWARGDYDNAIARMNTVRGTVGLPPLVNPGTREGVQEMLLEERFATLYLEGQRANDLYRFNLFPQVIGTGFNTKFPLPAAEAENNPNVARIRSCPAIS